MLGLCREKTCVTPIKKLTLPRLELANTTLLSELDQYLKKTLNISTLLPDYKMLVWLSNCSCMSFFKPCLLKTFYCKSYRLNRSGSKIWRLNLMKQRIWGEKIIKYRVWGKNLLQVRDENLVNIEFMDRNDWKSNMSWKFSAHRIWIENLLTIEFELKNDGSTCLSWDEEW